MKLTYKLEEEDFLQFQLFVASNSKRVQKNIKHSRIALLAVWIACSVLFYLKGIIALAISFVIVAILSFFFHKRLIKRRYRKHFESHIQETNYKRFGEIVETEFLDSIIHTKNKMGESSINISEVESISETKEHFFIKISSGVSLLIPKKQIEALSQLRETLAKLNAKMVNETNWEW